MSCPDIVTRAEFNDLVSQFDSLQNRLNILFDAFLTHDRNNVFQAHNYSPQLEVNLSGQDTELIVEVVLDNLSSQDSRDLSSLLVSEASIEIVDLGNSFYQLRLTLNDQISTADFTFADPEITIDISEISPLRYGLALTVGTQQAQTEFEILIQESEETEHIVSNLRGEGIYQNDYLTISIADGESQDTFEIYLPQSNSSGGGGGGGNGEGNTEGGEQVSCEGISQELQDCCGEILAAINNLANQLSIAEQNITDKVIEVEEVVTIDISGTTPSEFACPIEEEEDITFKELPYKGAGLLGLHQLTQSINKNLQLIFSNTCEPGGVLATPAWWQVRLGGNIPQLICTFRRVGSRNYHDLHIPHPTITERIDSPILPEYQKGNFQGMIICTDNSKFIINCASESEANRMCQIARSFIQSSFLPSPFIIHITKRRGGEISEDLMKPTSVLYYSEGQRNSNPDWYSRVTEITSQG